MAAVPADDKGKEEKRPKPVVEEVEDKGLEDESFPETPTPEQIEKNHQQAQTPAKKEETPSDLPADTPSNSDMAVEPPADSVVPESNEVTAATDEQTESVDEGSKDKKGGSFKAIFFTALITAIVVAALAGGLYVYLSGVNKLPEVGLPQTSQSPSPTSTPAPTPTASPSAELDLTKYSVQVLNGSGTAGVASDGKALLVAAGFKVSDAGNAPSFDFTDTLVSTKKDVPEAVVDAAVATLKDNYSVSVGDSLATSSTYDIVVTMGSLSASGAE